MDKKENIPHHSIIHVKIEKKTFESLPDGRISTKMAKDSIQKISKVFYAYGDSLEQCEEKAGKIISKLVNKLELKNEKDE